MKKYVVLILLVVVLIVLVIWVEPTGTVRGRLRGERFFRGRPTSYWANELSSEDPAESAAAQKQLSEGGGEAVAVLDQILRTHQGDAQDAVELRVMATKLLGGHAESAKAYSGTLVELLNDSDRHVRTVAAVWVPKIGTPAEVAVPALTKLLDGEERIEVARALSEYQAEAAPALEKLVEVLNNKTLSSEARWNAARTLGKMRAAGAPAIPHLVACLEDEAPTVREHSAEALGDIGPAARESVDALIAALSDEVPRVRRDAARSLGQIGVAEPKVIEALQQLAANDPEAEVREFASTALQALGAKPEGGENP